LIKYQNVVLLSNEEDILGISRSITTIFETPSDIQEVHPGEENTIIATEVLLAVKKTRKVGKAAGRDDFFGGSNKDQNVGLVHPKKHLMIYGFNDFKAFCTNRTTGVSWCNYAIFYDIQAA